MKFTNEQIRKLVAALPGCTDARRLKLLPRILKAWGQFDLEEHLRRSTSKQVRARRQQIEKVAKRALELRKGLSELETRARFAIISELLEPGAASRFGAVGDRKRSEAERRLREEATWLKLLARAANAASTAIVPPSFRQKTVVRYLILQDLAAIYEWATKQRAGRRMTIEGLNYGPFWDFACTAWSILFGSGAGLENALKSWASARARNNEPSPLIWNLHLRHPQWRIHKT